MKKCPGCEIIRPFSAFYSRKVRGQRTVDSRCKSCRRKQETSYRRRRCANDPEFVQRLAKYTQDERRTKAGRIRIMIGSIKLSAAKRKRSCTVTKSDIASLLDLQNWSCAKTGIPFDLRTGQGRLPFGPAIDRINTSLGYEPENIQIVCNVYNFAKNEFDDSDVLIFAKALVENQKSRST